jgi:hypothetical protein
LRVHGERSETVNYQRVVIGGLVAGVICFIGDGVVHGVLLQARWNEIAAALHLTVTDAQRQASMPWFLLYDVVKGLGALLVYALIRPRLGPGPRTAVVAGLVTWALCIPIPLAGLLPMHFFGRKFALLWSIYGAFPVVIGAVAGAALYKEEARSPA